MADITTAIISGSFAVAGCFGSVLLRAYLERRGQGRVSQPAPSDRTARLRPLFIAFIGFAAGIASCLLAPMFFPQPFYGVEMVLFCILLLVVLFAIIHHGRSSLARGLVIYQLEVLSLWAAFARWLASPWLHHAVARLLRGCASRVDCIRSGWSLSHPPRPTTPAATRLNISRRNFGNRRFKFDKSSQLFIPAHNETLAVVAMSFNNPDCSPVRIQC